MRFIFFFFFFNDTATTEIYTLSLHDALPISRRKSAAAIFASMSNFDSSRSLVIWRSEEHTSELQSQSNLVCRLLLEKKKNRDRRRLWRWARRGRRGGTDGCSRCCRVE